MAGCPSRYFLWRSLGLANQHLHIAVGWSRRTSRPRTRRLHIARNQPGEFPGSSLGSSTQHAIPAVSLSRLRHAELRPKHGMALLSNVLTGTHSAIPTRLCDILTAFWSKHVVVHSVARGTAI